MLDLMHKMARDGVRETWGELERPSEGGEARGGGGGVE